MNLRSEDISDLITPEGLTKLKRGMILRFNYEGSLNELKITYINKTTGVVRARKVQTYSYDEVDVVDKVSNEKA